MNRILLTGLWFAFAACAPVPPQIPIDSRSVAAGSEIMRGSDTFKLLGKPLRLEEPLPSVSLVNKNLRRVDISELTGDVLLISVVPSLDTQVCERQTHILATEGAALPDNVTRITISRDLPFAQKRFSEAEAVLGEVLYLSDYAQADFGRSTGLLIDQIHLLARAVIVADQQGIVRYLQVVPSITHLPDLKKGIEVAARLAGPG